MRAQKPRFAIALAAILLASVAASRAEVLETLDGDARVLASPPSLEPGAPVATFLLASAGPHLDVRDAPGVFLLFTDDGALVAVADADAPRFAPWRRDPESGRPIGTDAPEGSHCATGAESACWRPGDPVPYSGEVAVALGETSFRGFGLGGVPNSNQPLFALICASSIGFSNLDRSACGTPVPLVPLNQDPAPPPRRTAFSVLGDSQQALLGCGAYWGTDCDHDGIDFRNADASVILQSWSFADAWDPAANAVSIDRVRWAYVAADPGSLPTSGAYGQIPGNIFASELAALSFNMQSLLVAFSVPSAGTTPSGSIDRTVLRAEDLFSRVLGQCSFAQPQFCASVNALLSLAAFTRPAGGDSTDSQRQWIWEAGAEYRVIGAYGDLGDYVGGRVHVLGVERSRTREASLGVPVALFPPDGATLAPDTRFAMPRVGDASGSAFGFAYLSAPEPSGGALAIAVLAALAAIARRAR